MTNHAWPPTTEADLELAMHNGLLIENQKLDLKRELKGGESGNKEIAKDIAAFSVHGGLIILGVDEGTPGQTPPSLTPVDLAGLSERVEQVGLTRVDEPVTVTTTKILSTSTPGKGYLLVDVPVSPRPPHMADNKYYSRGDKTNIVLSNAEVIAWHEKTLSQTGDAKQEIHEALQHLAATSWPWVDVLIVATPLGAREDILMALATSTSWQSDVQQLLQSAAVGCHEPKSTLRQPTQVERDADGLLATTDLTNQQEKTGYKRVELVLDDSGKLTLRAGGLTAYIPQTSPARHGVKEPLLLGHVELMVHLAGEVSKYGFNGSWRFALAARSLGKARSLTLSSDFAAADNVPVYRPATYDSVTTASLQEINDSPHAVVRRLVSKLLRALGSDGQWPWLFS